MYNVDIVTLAHLASRCIEEDKGFSSPWYTNIRNRWAFSLRQSGSALISLYLANIVVDKNTSERLIKPLPCACRRLCDFEDTIPAAWLNQLDPQIAPRFADFDNKSLKKGRSKSHRSYSRLIALFIIGTLPITKSPEERQTVFKEPPGSDLGSHRGLPSPAFRLVG
jgi:hypothetical protein